MKDRKCTDSFKPNYRQTTNPTNHPPDNFSQQSLSLSGALSVSLSVLFLYPRIPKAYKCRQQKDRQTDN